MRPLRQLVRSFVDRSARLNAILCWAAFFLIWFLPLGFRDLIHPDEGRYATLSLHILQSGDWITPRLNGLLYFEKPALQYWAGALSFIIFGVNEFAARFWPACTGFITVLMVGFTARRLWGQTTGNLSTLIAGSTTWIIGNSHFLTLDMGLAFFLTAALSGFLLAQHETTRGASRGWMWLAWAAMAGATLSKGLIGLAIPGATLFIYSLWNRHWTAWRQMYWWSGGLVYLVLTAPWFIMVSLKNPGFAAFFFIREHVERFLTTGHQRPGPVWYFVPCLLLGFLPWSTLLFPLFKNSCRRVTSVVFQPERLLISWVGFVFVFFSLSGSKLPSYILPMFPALALLAGRYLKDVEPKAFRIHLVLPVAVWCAVIAAYPFNTYFASDEVPFSAIQSFSIAVVVGGLVFVAAAVGTFFHLKHSSSILRSLLILAFGNLLATTIISNGYDVYGKYKSSRTLVTALSNKLPADIPFYSVCYYDQTLPFYLRRPVTLVDYVDEFYYGESKEASRWIPTLAEFITRWTADTNAVAIMMPHTFRQLTALKVPMRVIYQEPSRLVVMKQ